MERNPLRELTCRRADRHNSQYGQRSFKFVISAEARAEKGRSKFLYKNNVLHLWQSSDKGYQDSVTDCIRGIPHTHSLTELAPTRRYFDSARSRTRDKGDGRGLIEWILQEGIGFKGTGDYNIHVAAVRLHGQWLQVGRISSQYIK